MPDQRSSSSSSSSSDDGKQKKSPRRRRSSSSESEKRRDSKRSYSSSDEDRKSKRRKELTVLSRNAKYGHRGFVGASFSRYKKESRSRSGSKERYRSRDYRQSRHNRRDVSRYSRNDSYRRRISDRRDTRRERHRSRDRNLRDRSRDRRRSKDRKERSRDRSEDKNRDRSKDRKERSRERSEDKKEKDRDRSKDRKERNRDRSKDRRGRNRSRSQSRSGDRSKNIEGGSRKLRDSSRERNKDKREKGRKRSYDRGHSSDRSKERKEKSRERRSHDRSQSKEKSKERGHDRSQSKERCKVEPNPEGDRKISSQGDQLTVEEDGEVSCSIDDKCMEKVSNIHYKSHYAISPEKGKDKRKSKGKQRKIEKERDTYEERRRETDYDKKRRKEYKKNDREISKYKSSLQQDDNSKPDEKMDQFASSLQIKKPVVDPLSKRTGGAYIPPGRLKLMQDQIKDKSSESFQRLSWEALKKSINGIVNKVNVSNIGIIIRELFQENIVRGRGLLCRSLMQAQSFSQTFTHVYSALVCAINSKFPQIGELLLNRLIIQLRRGIKRNDKNICMASCKFLAHLVNQQVAHEVIALELLTLLLEKAKDLSDDSENGVKAREASIELSIVFLKECGMKLGELTPKGLTIITESLRNILHEGKLDSRYRYMVESLLAIQKDKFKGFESVNEDLDLVDDDDKITHIVELDGQLDGQDILNIFKVETDYLDNEAKYKELKAGILGASDDDESESDGDGESGSDEDESGSSSGEEGDKPVTNDAGDVIVDRTETNLIAFRRTVYLTIQSSLDVDECAHKLLKGEIKPGWEEELSNMIIDCCAQQRTYMKFYGLLAERFCRLNKTYREFFETLFVSAYSTCHRLEIEKLRNVSKLFSHLLHTDAISWEVMANVQLNEDQTTSSSRVFLKILFEELANFMGLNKLNERLREPTLSHAFEGLLPKDNPNKTRFAINFFTMIGLGGLTDGLREFLRTQPKPTAVVAPVQKGTSLDSSSTDSEDSSEGSSSSSSDDDSDSSDSSSESSSSSSDDDSGSDDSDDSSGSEKGSKAKKKRTKKGKSKSTSSSLKKRPTDETRPSVRSYISSDKLDKKTSSSSSSSRKRSSRI